MIYRHNRYGLVFGAVTVAGQLLTVSEAHAQRRIRVNVDSQPQGAVVRLDNESSAPLGTTPRRGVSLPSGAHTLFFTRDGYLPARLEVNIRRRNENFTTTMVQAGSIYVSADVDGAQIVLDGQPVGTTPGRINNVSPGQHIVEVRPTGNNLEPFRETVTVGAGAVASVNATLRPRQAPTGIVRVIVSNPNGAVPPDLQVSFDGTALTGSPPAIENAPPGEHIVQVSGTGFRTVRRSVSVTAGQTIALAIDLEPAQAQGGNVRVITSTEGAQVLLDGEVLSGSPAQREGVPPGTHVLRVTAPGRRPFSREITVTLGQQTTVEVPDLERQVEQNRILVRSSTPDAHVFIDGRDAGPSPYSRDDMPAGTYAITVRAPGFDDRTDNCVISASQGCTLDLQLNRTLPRATLHLALRRPIQGAMVVVDDGEPREIGAGIDLTNLTAGPGQSHTVRVQATGYQDFVQTVNLEPGSTVNLDVPLRRTGVVSGNTLFSRRSAISTWGASPLSRGDAALDIFISGGQHPIGLRGTIGILNWGLFGVDAGVGFRSMIFHNEIDLRARAGLRIADGLFSVGAELRPYFAFGFPTGFPQGGIDAYATISLHSLALAANDDDLDPAAGNNEGERSNPLGSFAFSLRFGVQVSADTLTGLRINQGYWGNRNGGLARTFDGPMGNNWVITPPPIGGDPNFTYNMPAGSNQYVITAGSQLLARPVAGLSAEVGLGRRWNLYLNLLAVFSDRGRDPANWTSTTTMMTAIPRECQTPNIGQPDFGCQGGRRAAYQYFWGGMDWMFYPTLGVTYKF